MATHELTQADPATLTIRANIRDVHEVPRDLVASIRERGVLEPVTVYRDGEDLVVIRGHRRTVAAREAGRDSVPVIVTDRPADADRLVDQWVENEHRTDLTTAERVRAVEQMALVGLTAGQIAKRPAMPKAQVQAALTASRSHTDAEHVDQLTLEQAAALIDFEDSTEDVDRLIEAAARGQFDHVAARLRADRAEAAALAEQVQALTEAGHTVVDAPHSLDKEIQRITALTNDGEHSLTEADHAECPGRVWVRYVHGWVTRLNGRVISEEEAETLLAAAEEDQTEEDLGLTQDYGQTRATVHGCQGWQAHHRER